MLDQINQILIPLLPFIVFVFLILVYVCVIKRNETIGWLGEHWVRKELVKLPEDRYKVINNVLLKDAECTYQIDHIVVSPYGIFVIETKQYNGFFTGNKYDKKWVMHAGKKKYYYENPIRQNYGHCKAVEKILGIDSSNIFNVVCIPSRATLKIKHDGELTRNTTIVKTILSHQVMVIENYDEVFENLKRLNIKDRDVHKQHIKNIKKNIV